MIEAQRTVKEYSAKTLVVETAGELAGDLLARRGVPPEAKFT